MVLPISVSAFRFLMFSHLCFLCSSASSNFFPKDQLFTFFLLSLVSLYCSQESAINIRPSFSDFETQRTIPPLYPWWSLMAHQKKDNQKHKGMVHACQGVGWEWGSAVSPYESTSPLKLRNVLYSSEKPKVFSTGYSAIHGNNYLL